MIDDAMRFAARAHHGQKYGDGPYTAHLANVYGILREYGWPEPVLVAGLLHDVIEDTDTTVETVEAEFGADVARLVVAVSNEPGGNRQERAAATLPRVRAAGAEAVAVKVADRLANVTSAAMGQPWALAMYRGEHAAFRAALYREDDDARLLLMWQALDWAIGEVKP